MNRFVARTALLAGAAYATIHGAPAGAETAPQCAPVYQDFETAADSQLLDTIGEFQSNYGTEVHVQIVADGTRYGVTSPGKVGDAQARGYLEGIADECKWDKKDLITILVSKSPRVYRVNTEGDAHETFSDNVLKGDREDQLVADLRDTSTSLQSDVNAYLENIRDAENDDDMSGGEMLVIGGIALVLAGGFWWTLRGKGGGYKGYGSSSSSTFSSSPTFVSLGSFSGGSGGTGGDY